MRDVLAAAAELALLTLFALAVLAFLVGLAQLVARL